MAEVQVVPGYEAGPVERFGRRIKLEYVGMTSVCFLIGFLIFDGLPTWWHKVLGAIGGLFLFLGLKKKTRNHFSGSLVLLGTTWAAGSAVVGVNWVLPFLIFAACVGAIEGYVEKHQEQMFILPLAFLGWGWLDLSWTAGLAFMAVYVLHPWTEKPGLRKRFGLVFAVSAVAPLVGWVSRFGLPPTAVPAELWTLHPLAQRDLIALVVVAVPTLACVAIYWRRLIWPHRLNPLLFALLAPWDVRATAMFAMVAAVTLCATVFRLSIDSDSLRPFFKHAEWHYFWYVFVLALWVLIR